VENIERLYFFFSGHGFHSHLDDRDYLLFQDAVPTSIEDTCISIDKIISYLRYWRAKTTILLIDACRATPSGGKSQGDWQPIKNQSLLVSGFATFWSCGPGERSYEVVGLKKGAFTFALESAFGNNGKCNTVYEVDEFLRDRVPRLCHENHLPAQHPYTQIEPLQIKNSVLVTDVIYRQNRIAAPLGPELRQDVHLSENEEAFEAARICGIDFGTSYSVVTLRTGLDKITFVPGSDGQFLIPSVVSVTPELEFLVGWSAVEYGRRHPGTTVYNIKRLFGSGKSFNIAGRTLVPEVIASLLIRSLARNVEEFAGRKPISALVSAPANFTIQQCNSLIEAFRLAEVDITRLIGEPSAAACLVDGEAIESAVVLDLGGGTLDVSVFEWGEGVIEIQAVGGDRNLGGVDFDEALERYLISEIANMIAVPMLSESVHALVRYEAERAKIALGTRAETSVILTNIESADRGLTSVEIPVTRKLFADLTAELNSRVERCIKFTLKRWGRDVKQLGAVILAGQGSKIFTVREIIGRLFPNVKIESKYQETAVAYGLGRYSGVLRGVDSGYLLLDCLPFEIGMRCIRVMEEDESKSEEKGFVVSVEPSANRIIFPILESDKTIPTRGSFYGKVSGTAEVVRLSLVERGTSGGTDDERLLGVLEVPVEGRSDQTQIEITVDVDAARTITMCATNHSTKKIVGVQLNNFFYDAEYPQWKWVRWERGDNPASRYSTQPFIDPGYTTYPMRKLMAVGGDGVSR